MIFSCISPAEYGVTEGFSSYLVPVYPLLAGDIVSKAGYSGVAVKTDKFLL